MDCYVNNNIEVSFRFAVILVPRNVNSSTARLFIVKVKRAFSIVPALETFMQNIMVGPDSLEYCRFEFGNSSGIHPKYVGK